MCFVFVFNLNKLKFQINKKGEGKYKDYTGRTYWCKVKVEECGKDEI